MTFDEVLSEVQALLRRERRVSYRGLKRRFALDDEYIEDLKEELIGARQIAEDVEVMAIYGAGREALTFIASRLPAYEFFIGSQERGLPTGIVYTPDEAFADPHVVARGFPTAVEQSGDPHVVHYPGAPYQFSRSPWAISRPAPRVGQHNAEILGAQL